MARSNRKLTSDTARKYDLELYEEFHEADSVEITLPEGYTAESIPQDALIKSQMGKYISSIKMAGNELIYYRSLEQYSGRFPAKDYSDFVKFYDAIYKADRNKVVLVKNEQLKGF
jgi:hypothetical protein